MQMARPQKEGLDYFPLDVDIDSDDRVEFILAKHGFMAFGILIKLLMEIYRHGYYIAWTERQQYVFAKRVNVDSMYTETVVSAYINEGIFDKELYEKYGILTSHGIQTRYLQASGRRATVEIIQQFSLLDLEKLPKTPKITFTDVSVCKNPSFRIHNDDGNGDNCNITLAETPQSKVKYICSSSSKGDETEDKDFAEVASLFSDNIHPITGEIEMDMLSDYYNEYGKKWTLEAIREAALMHGNSVKYIGGILKQWKERGFKAPPVKKGGKAYGGNGSTRRKVKIEGLDDFDRFEEWQKQNRPWDVQPKPGSDGEEQGDHPESGGSASEMQGMQGELLAGGELQGDGPCPGHLRGQCV